MCEVSQACMHGNLHDSSHKLYFAREEITNPDPHALCQEHEDTFGAVSAFDLISHVDVGCLGLSVCHPFIVALLFEVEIIKKYGRAPMAYRRLK